MPYHVLYIEADSKLAKSVTNALSRADVVVTRECDASSALRRLGTSVVDLIVVDSDLKGLGPRELLASIRQRFPGGEVPVAVIAGDHHADEIHAFLDLGAADVVRKPILSRLLAHKLLKLIELHGRREDDFGPEPTPTSDTYRLDFTRDHHELPDALCDHCGFALHASAVTCEECRHARPHDGWPRLDKSAYPYLGRSVDRYYLEKGIGHGATAQVYRGVDTSLGQRVAIKVISLKSHVNITLDEVKREVRAAAAIESPNVVAIWDVLTLNDHTIAIVMELARGKALSTMIHRDAVMPAAMALDIAQQVADALHAAHQCNIVHRDIKPANVIVEVGTSGRLFAKVVDFGIADLVGESSRDKELFYGTPAYAAPEQVNDRRRIDPRTDLYSLGAMLHHLLSGHPPFEGPTQDVLVAQVREVRPPLSAAKILDVELRTRLDALLDRAMAKRVEDRFASVLEFNEALSGIQAMMRGRSALPAQAEDDLHPAMSNLLKDYLKP